MKKSYFMFYFGVLPGLFIQAIGAYLYFIYAPGGSMAGIFYSITKVLLLLWPLLWGFSWVFKYMKGGDIKVSLKFGFLFGVLVSFNLLGAFFMGQPLFEQFAPIVLAKVTSLGLLENYLLFAVFLSVFHSLIEEYYWRLFIFKGLMLRLSPVLAGTLGSAGFALHHYIVLSQFFPLWLTLILGTGVGVGGFLWCMILHKTKTFWGNWLSHFMVDVAIMLVGYLLIS